CYQPCRDHRDRLPFPTRRSSELPTGMKSTMSSRCTGLDRSAERSRSPTVKASTSDFSERTACPGWKNGPQRCWRNVGNKYGKRNGIPELRGLTSLFSFVRFKSLEKPP